MLNWREDDLTAWAIGWAVLWALRGDASRAERLFAAIDPQVMIEMLGRIPGMQIREPNEPPDGEG